MWSLFFELHPGLWLIRPHREAWHTTDRIPRSRTAVKKSSYQTEGIHTRPAAIRSTDLEAPLREVDRKDLHLCHLPFLRERYHALGRHHTPMPTGGASTPSVHTVGAINNFTQCPASPLVNARSAVEATICFVLPIDMPKAVQRTLETRLIEAAKEISFAAHG